MNNNLLTCINSIINDCQSIENINSGGCGIFAYLLSEQLSKYNVEFQYCYMERSKSDIINALEHNWVPYHIVIKIKNKYIDSKYILNRKSIMSKNVNINSMRIVNIDDKYLKNLIDTEDWNDMYDRRNNRKIKRIIRRNFKKYIN